MSDFDTAIGELASLHLEIDELRKKLERVKAATECILDSLAYAAGCSDAKRRGEIFMETRAGWKKTLAIFPDGSKKKAGQKATWLTD
jgi:hypothetical protein